MILPILLLGILQAPAATEGYPVDVDCQEHRDGGTLAMSECLTAQSAVWDRRLDREYRAALVRAGTRPVDLRAAQRIGRRYRGANCLAYRGVRGSIATILAARCRRDMTRDRTPELHRMTWVG